LDFYDAVKKAEAFIMESSFLATRSLACQRLRIFFLNILTFSANVRKKPAMPARVRYDLFA